MSQMTAVSVARLAEAKKLPVDFLHSLGLEDYPRGVRIPYYGMDRNFLCYKSRTALQAKEGSFWPKGQKLEAYGLWRLERARGTFRLFLVEGESDCWALWNVNQPALGIPGAGTAGVLLPEHLENVRDIYLHREPDRGGEIFIDGCLRRLQRLGYSGRLHELRMPEGIKDPSELQANDPENFTMRLLHCIQSSKPLSRGWAADVAADVGWAQGSGTDRNDRDEKPSAESRADEEVSTRLSEVKSSKVDWLWPGRVPMGKLTILDGDPGLGKSSLTLDLAARVSRGLAMPDADVSTKSPPASVVLLSAEDGLGDTIRPRLEAAGADLERVFAFDGLTETLKHGHTVVRPPELPRDVPTLAKIVARQKAQLVVIDPLMAFLGETQNSNNDQSMRRALLPLAKLAELHGCAIIVVRHLNKNVQGQSLYRGGGSIGIIGAARSGLLVAKDPDDAERRVLAVTKSNLAKKAGALAYRMKDSPLGSMLAWEGPCDLDADALLQPSDGDSPALDEAVEFLQETLQAGPCEATVVLREASSLGIAERTLKRAKRLVGVQASLRTQPGQRPLWQWALSDPQPATLPLSSHDGPYAERA